MTKPPDGKSDRNKRSLRGMLVRPRAQLRHAYLVALVGATGITVMGTVITTMNARMLNDLNAFYQIDTNIMNDTRRILALGVVMLILAGILAVSAIFAFVILISHRFFGPLVPLNAQIEKMINGDFSARVHLRREDELQELAASLNALAAKLESNNPTQMNR